MKATIWKDDQQERVELHFSHAIDSNPTRGFGQLWIDGRWHIEFTKSALVELAEQAAELAANL